MTLEELGYNSHWEQLRKSHHYESFGIGRIISEHKERYIVKTPDGEYEGEIIGNLRFTAQSRSDYPAVGDWVAISEYDPDKVLIHGVLPRETVIERQAVGNMGEKQIIAANIDYALIVVAADRDFNINRLERYLTLCYAAKVSPMIVLTKVDLVTAGELEKLTHSIEERIEQVPVIEISNQTLFGITNLKKHLKEGKTYCLLGSSGVGKSTLTNNLMGTRVMKTNPISSSTQKGRHVTSHRQLHVLEGGGMLVDNPGMREVGITESEEGIELAFDTIAELSVGCRFRDCSHTSETGCAVIAAVDHGELDRASYENYLRMEREREHFDSTIAERRMKDKSFGKMIKNYKKDQGNQ